MAGELYIGIDVNKDRLEVAFGCDGEVRQVANADRAIMVLAAELKELGPKLVVMEASGGYERIAAALLWEAELPVVIANPTRCAISPKAWASMPRPIGRTRASLRAGRRSSSRRYANCPMRRAAN
jgi:hypothetical protein